jgi:hypothetical protein
MRERGFLGGLVNEGGRTRCGQTSTYARWSSHRRHSKLNPACDQPATLANLCVDFKMIELSRRKVLDVVTISTELSVELGGGLHNPPDPVQVLSWAKGQTTSAGDR